MKPTVSRPSKASVALRELSAADDARRLLAGGERRGKGRAVDRGDRLQRLRAGGADVPGVGDGAVDDRRRGVERLAERDRLRGIARLVRRAAVERIGVAVVAGDGLGGGDAARDARIAIAFEGERDDDHRIGRGGQGRAGAGGGKRRRAGRAQRQRSVAAEQRGLLLAHRLLQQAQRRRRVDVLEALRGGFGFEGHRVFLAERQIGRDLKLRGIGHARRALALGHPAHRVIARAGDRGDGAPARGVAGVEARDARQRVPQRRDDGIEILGRRLKIVGGQAGGERHALGERFLHQAEGFLRGLGNVHGASSWGWRGGGVENGARRRPRRRWASRVVGRVCI